MAAAADQLFIHHVQELRRRLLISISFLLLASAGAYAYRAALVHYFTQPLHQSLIYTAPSGGLQFLIQICLTMGAIVALPIFIYNTLRFILPAFEQARIKKLGTTLAIIASYLLALAGAAFAYWLVLPMSFHFFASFNVNGIRALISTSEYFSFVLGCLVTFAAIFQLPLLLLLWNKINRFPPGSLTKYRRHVIVGSLALALVLPFTYDPLTQFVIAIPVIALYEVSILGVWVTNRRHYVSIAKLQADQANTAALSVEQAIRPKAIAMPLLHPDTPLVAHRARLVRLG